MEWHRGGQPFTGTLVHDAAEGDLTSILRPSSHAEGDAAGSLTFAEGLANQQWKAVTVRNALINDGERKTFPWDFGSPPLSTQCPTGGTWELSVSPHVTEEDPARVHIEVQILPTQPPGITPEAEQIPEGCGARTTLVLDDQQLGVLTYRSQPEPDGVLTTVTPYVVWEERDLMRLAECKRTHLQPKVDREASSPPQRN